MPLNKKFHRIRVSVGDLIIKTTDCGMEGVVSIYLKIQWD